MALTFRCKDQDLLLSIHGEVGFAGQILLQLHMLVCPSCRARRKEFERVSTKFAAAFSGVPVLAPSPRIGQFNRRTVLAVALAVASLALLAASYVNFIGLPSSEDAAVLPPPITGGNDGECNGPTQLTADPTLTPRKVKKESKQKHGLGPANVVPSADNNDGPE